MFKLPFNDLFRHSDFVEEKHIGNQRILTHNKLGKIVFRRNSRCRNVRISLRPHQEILVSMPTRCSFAEADKFLCSKMDWVTKTQDKLNQRQPAHKAYSDEEIKSLRQKAKIAIPQRTSELAAKYGFSYSAVSVKNMHSRWGSCSYDNRLNFTIFLINLPVELMDYVILHELCHTVHKNHGTHFWNLLGDLTQGQARALSKQIKQYAMQA
jgi:predicted metal-dependent hydrolase